MTRSPKRSPRVSRRSSPARTMPTSISARMISPRQQARVAAMVEAAERPAPRCWRAAPSRPMRRQAASMSRRCCSARSIRDPNIAQRGSFRAGAVAVSPSTARSEAIALANGTDYGLVAGIWTRDGARQHRVAKRVRAGQVFVNGYGAGGGIELPFGGFRQIRPRPRKGFRGALRHVGDQDDRLQPRLIDSESANHISMYEEKT